MTETPIGTRQAADIAKRHQRTIVAWIQTGKLKAFKMPGQRGPYLINRSDLHATIAALTTPKPYIPEGHDDQPQG